MDDYFYFYEYVDNYLESKGIDLVPKAIIEVLASNETPGASSLTKK